MQKAGPLISSTFSFNCKQDLREGAAWKQNVPLIQVVSAKGAGVSNLLKLQVVYE